jgi:hypothetical protein
MFVVFKFIQGVLFPQAKAGFSTTRERCVHQNGRARVVDVGGYFCYLAVATVYLHGVGPVGDLGVHGPVQRDKLFGVESIHDNNDKAVIHQGSGPNLNKKEAIFKEKHGVRDPMLELTIASLYLIDDSKSSFPPQRRRMPTNVFSIIY